MSASGSDSTWSWCALCKHPLFNCLFLMDNAHCPHAGLQQSLGLHGNCFSSIKPFSHAQCRPLRQWTAQCRPFQAISKHQEHSKARSSEQQLALIPSGLQPGLDRVHDTPAVVWFLVVLQVCPLTLTPAIYAHELNMSVHDRELHWLAPWLVVCLLGDEGLSSSV